jgi:hypothetical protein
MDPNACTIILLQQKSPFYISDNEDVFTLLESVFGHGK